MAHGITKLMRNIRNQVPQEWIAQHENQNRDQRRHFRPNPTINSWYHGRVKTNTGAQGAVVNWPRELRASGTNRPYVNPARDSKPGRRLRKATS